MLKQFGIKRRPAGVALMCRGHGLHCSRTRLDRYPSSTLIAPASSIKNRRLDSRHTDLPRRLGRPVCRPLAKTRRLRENEHVLERVVIKGYRIFKELNLELNSGVNIIVGQNESGKSTLLEAISMTLTGRIHGQWLSDHLNPYWFNQDATHRYLETQRGGRKAAAPEILIELYLRSKDPDVQQLRGINNSLGLDQPGLQVRVAVDPEFTKEFNEYVSDPSAPLLLPSEFYKVEWRSFQGSSVGRRPRALGIAQIDSRTLHSSSGVDFHTRRLLLDHIDTNESARISLALRKAKHEVTERFLSDANERIRQTATASGPHIGLQIDQTAGNGWQGSVVPQVGDIPFAMSGQGQQAASKVALAMSRTAETTSIVLVEEPENHLAHTRLTRLMGQLETLAEGRQMIVTTHSSYVLNRLGIGNLLLINRGTAAHITDVPEDTIRYFKRLSGYDTLRMVLADKLALVEGPADEMILSKAYRQHTDRTPSQDGIDIVSIRGTAFKRSLELCKAIEKDVIFLRDNDGEERAHWEQHYGELLSPKCRMFMGEPSLGATLEPQIIKANESDTTSLLQALDLSEKTDALTWICKSENKTEAALRIFESKESIKFPPYIIEAVKDLCRDW